MICLLVALCEPLIANWMRPDRLGPARLKLPGRKPALSKAEGAA